MGSRYDRKRLNVEGDRLSSLPDDLIHKILSFIGIEHAVRASVLSSRWRYIWISMTCLNFSSKDFHTLPKFSKFVKHVLSGRNNQIEVLSVGLSFRGKVNQVFVKKILDYAFSHKVQQLNITCLSEEKIEFPLSLFRSYYSLSHLTLTKFTYKHSITTELTWKLPALTTLNLHHVTLYDDNTDKWTDLLSNCANLKNLTLKKCRLAGSNSFNIYHHGLSSLTLEDGCKGVNVDTPQLKNLNISNWRRIHLISAPNLSSLRFKDDYWDNYYYYSDEEDDDVDLLQLSMDFLHLEKVDLCIQCPSKNKAYPQKIVCLLQQLHGVKYLTLNLELVKLLSLSMELISHQPSPFTNLKSLKIYPTHVTQPEVTMSTEVKNYLLDSSPGAILTMVSYEEIRVVMNVASARNLMGELHVLLDQWKENSSKVDAADMEQDKAPMESHITTLHEQVEVENHKAQPDMKVKWHFEEKMTHVESYWEDLNEQLEKGYENTRRTISMLREIIRELEKIPKSDRAELEARFSGLRAEAETIMYNVMDRMKIQHEKKPSHSNVFLHGLATSSQQSF